jgi:hypothetical protein
MNIYLTSNNNLPVMVLCVGWLYIFSTFNMCHAQDSLDYSYSIVGMAFFEDHDIIKIKVPPWLKTSELVSQIKRILFWPGSPPPHKKTYIYVFKETDQTGESSNTGAIYIPQKGFIWKLSEWKPSKIPDTVPSRSDFSVYYSLIDQIIESGSSLDDTEVKQRVATNHNLTLYQLDSIYSVVKYWLSKKQNISSDTLKGK